MSSLGIQYWTVLVSKILAPGVVTAPQWLFTGGNVASMELGEDFSKIGLSPICIRSYKTDSILWPDSSESKIYHNLPINKNPINSQIAMTLPWISLARNSWWFAQKLWHIASPRWRGPRKQCGFVSGNRRNVAGDYAPWRFHKTGWFTEGSPSATRNGEWEEMVYPPLDFSIFWTLLLRSTDMWSKKMLRTSDEYISIKCFQ